MICEHSLIYSRQRLGFDMMKELSLEEIKNFTPVEQPLVRKNKVTNRKTIFLSSHIGKIKNWIRPDSMCFIDDLIEYATQLKFKYIHEWSKNDLIIWDNRQTMHLRQCQPAHAGRGRRALGSSCDCAIPFAGSHARDDAATRVSSDSYTPR